MLVKKNILLDCEEIKDIIAPVIGVIIGACVFWIISTAIDFAVFLKNF